MSSPNPELEIGEQDASMPTIIALEASPNHGGLKPAPEEVPDPSQTTLLVIQQPESEPAMSKLEAALTAPRKPSSSKATTPAAASSSAAASVVLRVEDALGRPRKQLQFFCKDGRVVSAPVTVGPPSPPPPPPPPPTAEQRPVIPAAQGDEDDELEAEAAAELADRQPNRAQWVMKADGGERRVDAVDAGRLESQLVLNADGVEMEAARPAPAVSHLVLGAEGGSVRALLPTAAAQAGPQADQQVVLAVDGNVIGTADQGDGRQIVLQVDEESDSVTLLVDRLEDGAVYGLAGGPRAGGELLELWERGAAGDRPVETVSEVSLVDIRAVCEQCGCAISHHMVGLLARQDGTEYGYRCRICQSVQTDVDEMARHMDAHRPLADSQCRFCSRGLRTFKPAGGRRYTCHACQLVFGSRHEMIKHREVHPPKRRFPCELCEKAFQLKVQLEVHMRTHLGHKPFSCDMCTASFTQPSHLINHRRTHTGERPYACEHCGRAFVQQGHLRAHERTHTGERPYTCDICDRGFRQSGQLTAHKKLHEGDAPFKMRRRRDEPITEEEITCRECLKTFKAPKDLRRHMLVHGAGEFKCETCERVFKRVDHLKRHRKQHVKPPRLAAPRRRRVRRRIPPGADLEEARGLSVLDEVIDAVLETPETEDAAENQLVSENDNVDTEETEVEDAVDDPVDDSGVSRGPRDALWSQADRSDDERWRRAEEHPARRPTGRAAYGRRIRLLPTHADDGVDEEMAMLEAALRNPAMAGRPRRDGGGPAAPARRRPPPEPTVKLEPVDWDNWDLVPDDTRGDGDVERVDGRRERDADDPGEGEDWGVGREDPSSGGRRRRSRDSVPDSSPGKEREAAQPSDWPILDVVQDSVNKPERRRPAKQVAWKQTAPRTSRRSTAGNWADSVGVRLTRTPGSRGKR